MLEISHQAIIENRQIELRNHVSNQENNRLQIGDKIMQINLIFDHNFPVLSAKQKRIKNKRKSECTKMANSDDHL